MTVGPQSLQVRELSVRYPGSPPVTALDQVDLDVAAGSIVAVLGPSGSGKTTLLRVIAGLERPGAGRVTLGETVLDDGRRHLAPQKRGVGLVPQEGALFPHLDVGANVAYGLRSRPPAERRARVDELLTMVGLDGLARRRPDQLSGGQQQRVALARALAPQPAMVLLDEPFSALDVGLRAEVRAEVTALLRAARITALIVTHDREEALEMADAVAVMRDGRIEQVGPPRAVYERPTSVWAGCFLGEAIVVPGVAESGTAKSALGDLPVVGAAVDGPVDVFVRPEQLRLRIGDHVAGAAGDAVTATVVSTRFRGPESAVRLAIDDVIVTVRTASSSVFVEGAEVAVSVDGPALAFPQPEFPLA